MEDPKIIKLELSVSELRDHVQGLDLLHSKCIDHSHALQSSDDKYTDLKKYFREKQVSLNQQIRALNNILLGTPKT